MATITFRAKVRPLTYADGTPAYKRIDVPTFKRSHCDMAAFRSHPKYGSYANSDLFPGILQRISESLFPCGFLKVGPLPVGVSIDTSGFLAIVTVTV